MQVRNLLIPMLLSVLLSVGAMAQNVSFNQMRIKPAVKIDDDVIAVYTSNSIANAGLMIYRIFIAVEGKSVFLSANQAMGKPYRVMFSINARDYGIKDPTSYKYYWLDPDRKRTQIDIITSGEAQKYSN